MLLQPQYDPSAHNARIGKIFLAFVASVAAFAIAVFAFMWDQAPWDLLVADQQQEYLWEAVGIPWNLAIVIIAWWPKTAIINAEIAATSYPAGTRPDEFVLSQIALPTEVFIDSLDFQLLRCRVATALCYVTFGTSILSIIMRAVSLLPFGASFCSGSFAGATIVTLVTLVSATITCLLVIWIAWADPYDVEPTATPQHNTKLRTN